MSTLSLKVYYYYYLLSGTVPVCAYILLGRVDRLGLLALSHEEDAVRELVADADAEKNHGVLQQLVFGFNGVVGIVK